MLLSTPYIFVMETLFSNSRNHSRTTRVTTIIRLLILDGAVGLDEEGVHLFAEMEFLHVVDVKAERSVRSR